MKSLSIRWARTAALAAMMTLVAACAGPASQHAVGDSAMGAVALPARADQTGPTVARHLVERYNGTRTYCGKTIDDPNRLPAVLCSGILLRATKRGVGYDVWNPNPGSPTPNGVPFSWLRQDSGFSALVYGLTNGFIILPHFYADDPVDGYTQLIVRCVFPFDGATNGRTGEDRDGCGKFAAAAHTAPCQSQGITTAQQWLVKFGGGSLFSNQCGFRLLPGTPDAWRAFHAQTEIRLALPGHFNLYNEIIVGVWAQNDRRLPLEAFFYINGNLTGLGEAKANQVDFKARTGRWVPVIRINLPTGPGTLAKITFNTADQGIQQ